MDENRRFTRRSIIVPLVLIALGVIFLLNNLGVLAGNVWDTILLLWPLILIAFGLDAAFRREGLVGAVFLIGLGTVFLFSNLGYLGVNAWEVVIRFWPLLLVAIGLDIVFGRRSTAWSLVAVAVFVVILIGALFMFGVGVTAGQALTGEEISQELNGASQARIELEPAAGAVRVGAAAEPDRLVTGVVRLRGRERVTRQFSVANGKADFALRGTGVFFGPSPLRGDSWSWDLSINPEVPLELKFGLGAGLAQIDLRGTNLQQLDANLGVGNITVTLPETGDIQAKVAGAIGQITILIPSNMAARVDSSTAIANLDIPGEFERSDNVYTTRDYATAENRVDLEVSQAIGNIRIRFISGE